MEITGTQVVPSPRPQVWAALNDPMMLKACLPGCESVEQAGFDEFKVVMAVAVGPLRARFKGALKITEVQAPESCVIVFEAQGGAMGFGKGFSSVELLEVAEGTEIRYTARAQVGGKLAQVGSRLIDSVARKLSDDFFEALRRQIQAPALTAPAESVSADAGVAVAQAAEVPMPAAQAVSPAVAVPFHSPAAVSSAVPMVPIWWLGIAMVLGSVATLAGALLLR